MTREHKANIGLANSISMRGNKNGIGNKSNSGCKTWNTGMTNLSETHPMMGFQNGHKDFVPEKSRKNQGLKVSGKNNPFYGKTHTDEFKAYKRICRLKQILPFKDTSIEIKLQNILKENGIKFQKHYPILGQPDIFIKPNICIFADGCYWHKCPECGYVDLKTNEKDAKITTELQKQGYVVIRLWEHQIKQLTTN